MVSVEFQFGELVMIVTLCVLMSVTYLCALTIRASERTAHKVHKLSRAAERFLAFNEAYISFMRQCPHRTHR